MRLKRLEHLYNAVDLTVIEVDAFSSLKSNDTIVEAASLLSCSNIRTSTRIKESAL